MIINSGTQSLPTTVRTEARPPAKQGPVDSSRNSLMNNVAEAVIDTTYFAFNELVEVGKNDPALALRYGATSISEKLLQGTDNGVREGFGHAIVPTIRLSILGANAYRLNSTLKDPTAGLFEKGLDIARVATDLVGLAGSVMKYVMPAKAALGDTLVGVSYAADTVSHSLRGMTHGMERATVWKKQIAERKAAKAKANEEFSAPPTPPVVATATAPTGEPIATRPLDTATPTYLLAN